MKTGAKLCIAISARGRPAFRLRSSSASIRLWYGRKISRTRVAFRLSLKLTFPGTGVSSPVSGIDVSEPGVRLQSMTRRE